MTLSLIWLFLVIVFIIVEISTLAYVSFWFIFGAVAAMFISLVIASTTIQIAVFLMVSLISLILLRPFALKFAKPKAKSNIDALIDKEGIVTEEINNAENKGRIKVIGQDWAALSENNNIIEAGKKVVILNVTGIKLIVREVD